MDVLNHVVAVALVAAAVVIIVTAVGFAAVLALSRRIERRRERAG